MIRGHLTPTETDDGVKHSNGLTICPSGHHRAENKLKLILTRQGYKCKGLLIVFSEDTPVY